jgi:hypothetical protein
MSLPWGVNCGPNLKWLIAKGYMQIVSDMLEVLLTGLISHTIGKFPLTPMGVLAHRLRKLDRSLVPPSA